jgi:hypothetical protein
MISGIDSPSYLEVKVKEMAAITDYIFTFEDRLDCCLILETFLQLYNTKKPVRKGKAYIKR